MPDSYRGTCSSCGAPIIWCVMLTKKGRNKGKTTPIPLDADPDNHGKARVFERGNVRFTDARDVRGRYIVEVVKVGEGLYVTHFATCPKAHEHRKADR